MLCSETLLKNLKSPSRHSQLSQLTFNGTLSLFSLPYAFLVSLLCKQQHRSGKQNAHTQEHKYMYEVVIVILAWFTQTYIYHTVIVFWHKREMKTKQNTKDCCGFGFDWAVPISQCYFMFQKVALPRTSVKVCLSSFHVILINIFNFVLWNWMIMVHMVGWKCLIWIWWLFISYLFVYKVKRIRNLKPWWWNEFIT